MPASSDQRTSDPVEDLCQRYSLAADHVLEDPFPSFEALREKCPLHVDDALANRVYSLSRRDDIVEALLDTATFSNRSGPGVGYETGAGMASEDPPEHGAYRRMVQRWFTPKAARDLGPFMVETANELIDGFIDAGEGDLRELYALPFPLMALSELMGFELTADERRQISRWAGTIVLSLVYPDHPDAAKAGKDFKDFASRDVARRREQLAAGVELPDTMMTHLATYRTDEGELLPTEKAGYIVAHLLLAGAETSVILIANALHRLLEDGGARWKRLRAEPELVPNVVEESLRFDPPTLGDHRVATRDVQLHGIDVPAGSKVMLLYAPTNRDETYFPNADEFVMDRPVEQSKRHLSFSYGIHVCLGAHLARAEAITALQVLLARLPDLELAGVPERVESPMFWGRRTVPVRW